MDVKDHHLFPFFEMMYMSRIHFHKKKFKLSKMSESVYSSEDGMEYVVVSEQPTNTLMKPTNTLMKGSVFCEVGNNIGMGIGLIEYNAFDEIVAKVSNCAFSSYTKCTNVSHLLCFHS